MVSFEVRIARTNGLARTFGDAREALDWAKANAEVFGGLNTYAVETIEPEPLPIGEPVIPARGAGGLRAGRGR